ncbi:MAG: hypothetical protein KBG48_09720 [Kofleriaceae bacterium]|nr:hypothetical protein [Kofleriaceae bacterium]MBP9167655.1 hypothetical protein [Kofleriaceae bacterium]MBP9856737.1 hypothetical protein [Kofleriaceae bacterium]
MTHRSTSPGILLCGLVGALASGCLFDPQAGKGPARFHVGPNARSLSVPASEPSATAAASAAGQRSASPAPSSGEQHLSANSVALQFTMATAYGFYAGAEAETGRLGQPGSNLAVASAIVGVDQDLGFGSVGAELAVGWQSVRYDRGDQEHGAMVGEPRIRGQVWIAEQWTLGAAVGTRLSRERSDEWMAGAYLGVHSHRF